jgi:tetratricopeptide (TPR) repeat protein
MAAVMKRFTVTSWQVLMLAVLLFSPDVMAWRQATVAEINGRIVDAERLPLANVAVTATNRATGSVRTVVTDENGRYTIAALPPGEYELSMEWAGFNKATRRVVVAAGSILRIDQSFSLSAIASTIVGEDGHRFYRAGDWQAAIGKYEEALRLDPDNIDIRFYLANSYDNLYRPSRKGEPANDAYLTMAIDLYRQVGERHPDPKMKRLALEYLVAAYGSDKLNDPTQAEPVVQQMIQLDPNEAANYFVLADIYEDSGKYELAEQTFLKAKEIGPNDPAVHTQLAAFYNRQGDFEKTVAALNERIRIEPNNAETYYTVATYYWDKAYRDFRLTAAQKMQYAQDGIRAADKALEIKSDYMEAIAYKNLLLRVQASLEKDPVRQELLLREADALRDRATELRKLKPER